MGLIADTSQADRLFRYWFTEYRIFAPKAFSGGGRFSDTDCVRYGEVQSAGEIEWEKKSLYSFKEVLQPVSETLFYFTENEIRETDAPNKGAILFLRSCDLHALKRMDAMYLHNGKEDYYYSRLRSRIRIVLMGCRHSYENCFCVSMGTNQSENYDMSMEPSDQGYRMDVKEPDWEKKLQEFGCRAQDVVPSHVTENKTTVRIPENLSQDVMKSHMWNEYDSRCIDCGRCNYVCPTCTCFTMQDLYYSENGKVGERRRIWASCMVDGYTDVAGGGSYRKKNGERMRFKTLHKVLDFRERNGFDMCVGCGRCDDICPEYISFSYILNKLDGAMKEVQENAGK